MSQNSKNGNIMSFFKPKTKSPTPKATKSSTPDPPSSPMLPSSPLEQKAATPVKKNLSPTPKRVIQASDDEDDFGASSDDSLEDISTMIGRGRPAKATQSPARNLFATPKAKRTAVEFRTSPLAIISKHKYDLKALAKDARQDNAITASSMRAKAFSDLEDQVDVQMTTDKASLDAMEGIVKNNTGQDAQKVMRAVKRSETGQSELRYCFFSQDYTLPPPNPPPKKFNKGHWKLLTKGDQKTREQHLASGVPLTLLHLQGGLPEELFDWILNDICAQKSSLVRQEYCNLLSNCTDLIEHCITPQRLEELLYRFGASSELGQRDSELDVSKPGVEPYEGRDWSPLSSFLSLLAAIPPYMSEDSVVYASQALLRMSMDRFLIYDIGLLTTYEITISILLEAIPQPRWDTFCFETCTLLHTLIKAQCIRTNALACLPLSKARAHEMRRRLAVVFLFDDPALGRCHPDDTVTIRGIIKRLDRSDFFVGPKTDFAELQANIILLNIAVDDGSFAPSDDPEHEKQFNKDIDELAVRLREIWRKINDSGMKLARTEAKSVIEWVEQRLAHSVRTRRKAKKSIFDLPGQNQDLCLPEQQNYMKNFLRKAPETTSVQAPKQLTSDTEGLKETRNPETIVAKFK
ncbi:hypothetical protein SNK03_004895 [Fusarium graminearum]|uniref:Chromosome 2, complete genome n=2 Tax=Gibberella zeae TaxID=5518 RepID=I1RWD0_GIBZE|nr:hypothetical protein FGSG_08594 [Fusarium graminearum PH-1]CAF3496888.1 unnamed protein product [Fusarium graminearum]ESU14731.1 hypothetical protein FGSG_08594 [Fusarium graminearum PH-1]CAG1975833.1 unnamed protein product [Fusarium graminearum]CEF76972.1 unnamed protein product [Fusarium graminearum]CZS80263.1 unnamed protein product [Fusarium graminearum]|eukprot:XP_011320156.1 hypothetical protein FGSG_08594 [Fusarium graminearum PH-1]